MQLKKNQDEHQKMLGRRQADLDKLKEQKMQQDAMLENERLEKAKHLSELEQLKLKEKNILKKMNKY